MTTPDDEPTDVSDHLRQALRRFAGGVTVVTCRVGGMDHAMTATAVAPISLDPPLLLVCVSKSARFNAAIQQADRWAVSFLSEEGQAAAEWLATPGRPLVGQLDAVAHSRRGEDMALLSESLAWVVCRTQRIVDAGDHDVVVGDVEWADHTDVGDPLLYWEGQYRRLSRR